MPGAALLAEEFDSNFTNDTEVESPSPSEGTIAVENRLIADEFLDAYFAHKPESFLVDPQGLLDPTATRDRLSFLNYHSSDSWIDFHVFVFGAEQVIPGEVRKEEIGERLFSAGKPSLILFYYLGNPERSEVYLSPSLTDGVTDAERRRILQSSVLAAMKSSEANAQLEAFCVQTSIRIYWIEKAVGFTDEETHPAAIQESQAVVPEVREPTRSELLAQWLEEFWWDWGAVVSISLVGVVIAIGSWFYVSSRARYRFPEFDVAARLGGAHAAGIGAAIGFGSTTQSPSTQHSDVPDYFGGI